MRYENLLEIIICFVPLEHIFNLAIYTCEYYNIHIYILPYPFYRIIVHRSKKDNNVNATNGLAQRYCTDAILLALGNAGWVGIYGRSDFQ